MSSLKQEFLHQGRWLFRWRSYLPLAILPLLLAALPQTEILERFGGERAEHLWEYFCFGLSLFGLGIRIATVGFVPRGTSGRNTKGQVADFLNTTGTYSLVRHPLYVGNFFMIIGAALFTEVWWFTLIVALSFWLYYERIIFAEEEFLRTKFGPAFEEWASRTPTVFPNFQNWRPPDLPFSIRTVLRRENPGFFAIIVTMTLLDVAKDFITEGRLRIEPGWGMIFLGGLAAYLVLLFLKKQTRLLRVEGR